jgi:anion-transporting  ArsA/GET3 family ATPase
MLPASPPSDATTPSLLEQVRGKRLVVVTGKGGTGKSTVTTALGMAAARAGLRTLLVETGGAQGLARLLGHPRARYRVLPVGAGLHLLSMSAHEALEDYAVRQLKLRSLYRLVFRNRFMGPFMDTVPGLPDIIQLGKVWDLAQERSEGRHHWDLIILDAPATGHGLTMLAAPRSMMEVTRSGPFHANAQRVHDLITDREKTALVLTTLPEPLPVNEVLQLYRGLGEAREQVAACVLNQVHALPFSDLEAWPAAREAMAQHQDEAWQEALGLCDHWVSGSLRQQRAAARLQDELGPPIIPLPYRIHRQLGLEDLAALAERFDGQTEGGA